MAEIGFSVLNSQCLNQRIAELSTIKTEVDRLEKNQGPMSKVLDSQLTIDDARIG